MARQRNIEKLALAIGGKVESFPDGSASWVSIENENYSICFSFDGKGNNYEGVRVCQKIYQVVDEKTIALIEANNKTK